MRCVESAERCVIVATLSFSDAADGAMDSEDVFRNDMKRSTEGSPSPSKLCLFVFSLVPSSELNLTGVNVPCILNTPVSELLSGLFTIFSLSFFDCVQLVIRAKDRMERTARKAIELVGPVCPSGENPLSLSIGIGERMYVRASEAFS